MTPGITAVSFDGGKLRSLLDEVYANAREDAATAIGNGNQRTLHTDITEVTLSLTVHSLGDYEGKTVVSISPAARTLFPIRYTYEGVTWHCGAGTSVSYRFQMSFHKTRPAPSRDADRFLKRQLDTIQVYLSVINEHPTGSVVRCRPVLTRDLFTP